MPVTASDVKALREKTGAGVMECKGALEESQGNVEKAIEILKQQGVARAEKKASRVASQGLVECYIHAGGRIGALVEVNCETDFVARTDKFKELAHNLAMQVAATAPCFVSPEEIPAGEQTDPAEACLLAQPFIKDPGVTVQALIKDAIASMGENIKVRRFARFELGN